MDKKAGQNIARKQAGLKFHRQLDTTYDRVRITTELDSFGLKIYQLELILIELREIH